MSGTCPLPSPCHPVDHYNEKIISGSEEERQYIKLFAALEAKGKFLSLVEQKRIEQRVMRKKE